MKIVEAVKTAIAVDSDYWKFYLDRAAAEPHYMNIANSALRDSMRMDYSSCSKNTEDRRFWQLMWRVPFDPECAA